MVKWIYICCDLDTYISCWNRLKSITWPFPIPTWWKRKRRPNDRAEVKVEYLIRGSKIYIDSILQKEMVSILKTFDVLKFGKMSELTQTKYIFGILIRFTHNIPYQTGFENSTGNTMHESYSNYFKTRSSHAGLIFDRIWLTHSKRVSNKSP